MTQSFKLPSAIYRAGNIYKHNTGLAYTVRDAFLMMLHQAGIEETLHYGSTLKHWTVEVNTTIQPSLTIGAETDTFVGPIHVLQYQDNQIPFQNHSLVCHSKLTGAGQHKLLDVTKLSQSGPLVDIMVKALHKASGNNATIQIDAFDLSSAHAQFNFMSWVQSQDNLSDAALS